MALQRNTDDPSDHDENLLHRASSSVLSSAGCTDAQNLYEQENLRMIIHSLSKKKSR